MEIENAKPISIITSNIANRRALVQALRSWAEGLPPNGTFEVQYTYDPNTGIRGFHLLFNEPAVAEAAAPAESGVKEVSPGPKHPIAA